MDRVGEHGPSEGHARLQEVLAYLLGLAGRNHESLKAAERAASIARAVGASLLRWRSENLRGRALIETGSLTEGLKCLERVITETASRSINEVSALNNSAAALTSRGSLAEARTCLERAVELTQKYASPLAVGQALGELSMFLAFICDWEAVQERLFELRSILSSGDIQWDRPLALARFAEGQVGLSLGDINGAEIRFGRVHVIRANGRAKHARRSDLCPAEIDLVGGRPQQALESIQIALEGGRVSERWTVALLPLLSWAQRDPTIFSRLSRPPTKRSL